jgi:hypothetical protein
VTKRCVFFLCGLLMIIVATDIITHLSICFSFDAGQLLKPFVVCLLKEKEE